MQPKLRAKLFEDLKQSIEDCEPEKAKENAQELVKTDINPLQVIIRYSSLVKRQNTKKLKSQQLKEELLFNIRKKRRSNIK